jgi:hypothetical protein
MDIIRSEQFAAQLTHFLSWPGIAVRRTASLPLAYVPAIHVLDAQETWMPGTSPGMTNSNAMHEDGNDDSTQAASRDSVCTKQLARIPHQDNGGSMAL